MIPSARMRAGAVTLFAITVLAAPRLPAEEINRIVATVDGEPVTAFEFRAYLEDLGNPPQPEEVMLDSLITEKLLTKEAAAKGIKVRDEDIDAYIEQVKTRNSLDDAGFEAALIQQGMDIESYRQRIRDELLRSQLVNQEIRSRVNVSPEEVERHYDANREEYRIGGGRTVRDIFFAFPPLADVEEVEAVLQRAIEVRGKVGSRRSFRKLAEEYSDGPGADQGGLLGTFEKGDMTDELDAVVFSIEPGEVSEPIVTGDGVHLIMVEGDVEASYQPIEELEDDIRDRLYDQALAERYQDWLAEDLREQHHVEVLN